MLFYGRLCVFSVLYSIATLGAAVKRIIEITKPGIFDDYHLHQNDPTMGLSALLPILALLEAIVILTTPSVARFYKKEMLGKFRGSTFGRTSDGTGTNTATQNGTRVGRGSYNPDISQNPETSVIVPTVPEDAPAPPANP